MARSLTKALVVELSLVLVLAIAGCGKKEGPSTIPSNNDNNENSGTNSGTNVATNNGGGNGQPGDPCTDPDDCASGSCRFQVCSDATCDDGLKNGFETDVDCGGLGCPLCNIGQGCKEDVDCVSEICQDGTCVESRCDDGERNGLESDVDCGGLFCPACDAGGRCNEENDCVSGVCDQDACAAATCDDGAQNGAETDEDCGGPDCESCSDGLACGEATDCVSGVCEADTCRAPRCDDQVQNGEETGADCGGNECDPCADGVGCENDDDCQSGVCDTAAGTCSSAACDDDVLNGTESDVDCGGDTCAPCDPGEICNGDDDCLSLLCGADGECTDPACDDFVQNGDETDVDCGGSCLGCADDLSCQFGSDCLSLVCNGGTCDASGCSDGVQNGDETDVDCGGSCNKCQDGDDCGGNGDCLSGVCGNGSCDAAACDDGVQNATETDVDCGGPCPQCDPGDGCQFGSDCTSGVCNSQICSMPTCNDSVTNGDETDIDCGGPLCDACQLGRTCAEAGDCVTNICDGGDSGPYCAICEEDDTQMLSQTCGYKARGRVEQTCTDGFWANSDCIGVWYGSCLEILEAGASNGDGLYDIDPDGASTVYDEFQVFCDMTTDGGGWTEITPCDADGDLHGVMVAEDDAANASVRSCKPETQDEGSDGHTYHYTFDFPAGFSEFFLQGYEARANGGGVADTSDLGFRQSSWSVAAGSDRGDISFGSGTFGGPVVGFSDHTNTSCFDCVIAWPDATIYSVQSGSSQKFRIGWGEQGAQDEGWIPWFSGTIRLR